MQIANVLTRKCQNKDLKDIEKLQQVFVPPPLDGGKGVAVVVVMAAKLWVTPPHQDAAVPQVMVPMVILRSSVQSAWTTRMMQLLMEKILGNVLDVGKSIAEPVD